MENLEIYIIKNCQYCILLKKLLNEFKIKHLIINVKENKKQEYKNKNIKTFPQVYYVKKKNKVLLGGYSDFFYIIDEILKKTNINKIKFRTKNKKNQLRIYTFLLKQLDV